MWMLSIVIAWLVLVLGWGGFWRADQRLGGEEPPSEWPEVLVVIPARDEAATIAEVVRAHGASDYPGQRHLIVVDDASSDGTGTLARDAGAEVLSAPPLPSGWSGKLAALNAGIAHGLAAHPGTRWVLLTDADIRHAPCTLGALVARGEAERLSLVSLMARLDARGTWAGLLIPAFVFFFQKLYPFPWVNRPGHWCAGAAGGCVLIRRSALEAVGGIAAIRDALIDDCTLAAKVKHTSPGRTIWLGLSGGEVTSLRDNHSFVSIWSMVTRTAFTQLHHSVLLLLGAVLAMAFLYLLPPALTVMGLGMQDIAMTACGGFAWALMVWAYAPTAQLYDQPSWYGIFLPAAAAVYTAMTVGSAVAHWRGHGGRWKGRTYP
ncbi:MAG: glycosyltransferase [Pseudomonadota bacterium]